MPTLNLPELRVHEIMTADPVCIAAHAPARELAELLDFEAISGVPVVDDQGCAVGIACATDLVALLAGEADEPGRLTRGLPDHALAAYDVSDVMMPVTLSVHRETTLPELARFLLRAGVDRALVLDGRHPVGIVTRTDVLRAVAGCTGRGRMEASAPAHA